MNEEAMMNVQAKYKCRACGWFFFHSMVLTRSKGMSAVSVSISDDADKNSVPRYPERLLHSCREKKVIPVYALFHEDEGNECGIGDLQGFTASPDTISRCLRTWDEMLAARI